MNSSQGSNSAILEEQGEEATSKPQPSTNLFPILSVKAAAACKPPLRKRLLLSAEAGRQTKLYRQTTRMRVMPVHFYLCECDNEPSPKS